MIELDYFNSDSSSIKKSISTKRRRNQTLDENVFVNDSEINVLNTSAPVIPTQQTPIVSNKKQKFELNKALNEDNSVNKAVNENANSTKMDTDTLLSSSNNALSTGGDFRKRIYEENKLRWMK